MSIAAFMSKRELDCKSMTATEPADADELIDFWLEAGPKRWFKRDDAFDARLRERFLALHERAARDELDDWLATPRGALALALLLDQFPRNAFRDTPRMYATDDQARRVARVALDRRFDEQLPEELRNFLYLPFMHSELLADHGISVAKTAALPGDPHRYALHHREIVARFGRFPHRNAILGRASTPEEARFIADGGFAG
jgi:uncharacterized protein (DUF924 family)